MSKKESTKKKISQKKVTSTKTESKKIPKNANIEKVLIENFISLQKVMTNFAIKFDGLSTQISKLLELFEISAKTLAEKDIKLNTGKEDKKIVEKLDVLLDQNKIIARGLTLLHENPESIPPSQLMQYPSNQRPPIPSQKPPITLQASPAEAPGGYQKSMTIKNQEPSSPKHLR